MKVKFNDSIAHGNRTYVAGDVIEVSDQTGQEFIDKGYLHRHIGGLENPSAH